MLSPLQKNEETYLRECSGDHQLRDGAKDAISYLDFQDVRICSFWCKVAACKRSWQLLTSLHHVLMEEALPVQSWIGVKKGIPADHVLLHQ